MNATMKKILAARYPEKAAIKAAGWRRALEKAEKPLDELTQRLSTANAAWEAEKEINKLAWKRAWQKKEENRKETEAVCRNPLARTRTVKEIIAAEKEAMQLERYAYTAGNPRAAKITVDKAADALSFARRRVEAINASATSAWWAGAILQKN